MSNSVYISLGSNLGDRERNILRAIEMMSAMEGFELIGYSPVYINPAVDMDENAPGFFNMVIKGEFAYRPGELLTNIEEIEKKLGRTDKGNNKPRTIDIDILLYGDEIMETDRLSIPHRKLTMRSFVLVPLLQIEPDIIHPVTKDRLSLYLEDVDQSDLMLYKEFARLNV